MKEHLANAFAVDLSQNYDLELSILSIDSAVEVEDMDSLDQYVPLALELSAKIGHPMYSAVALRSSGVMHRLKGGYKKAEKEFTVALESFDHQGLRWQAGRTYLEMGKLALQQKDGGKAKELLRESLKLFEEVKTPRYAAQSRELLDEIG